MAGTIDTSFFSTDLQFMIADMHQTVTGLGSSAVSASVTDLATSSQLDIGGEVFNITQSLIVLASSISAPTIGSLCTVSGTERMIGGFSQSTDGLSFTIELAEITT
jgi:hypothetical protein